MGAHTLGIKTQEEQEKLARSSSSCPPTPKPLDHPDHMTHTQMHLKGPFRELNLKDPIHTSSFIKKALLLESALKTGCSPARVPRGQLRFWNQFNAVSRTKASLASLATEESHSGPEQQKHQWCCCSSRSSDNLWDYWEQSAGSIWKHSVFVIHKVVFGTFIHDTCSLDLLT